MTHTNSENGESKRNYPEYCQKTIEAFNLVDAGMSPKQALQATNFKKDISPAGIANFKKKYKKHSLTHPKLIKLAHHAVTDCLTDQPIISTHKDRQGREITEETPPTWSNKLAAASMVYDRFEPVKQPNGSDGGMTVNIIPIAAQEVFARIMASRVKVEGGLDESAIDAETS
jgi:hypothetical protein